MSIGEPTREKMRGVHNDLFLCEGLVRREEWSRALHYISNAIDELEELQDAIEAHLAKKPEGGAE